jgi:phosphocarrier protein FPr
LLLGIHTFHREQMQTPYLDLDTEANPFLGQRGIRYCLDYPEIFKTQLGAILQAGSGHNVKLMFPMIGNVAEVRAAKELLAEVRAELRAEALPLTRRWTLAS